MGVWSPARGALPVSKYTATCQFDNEALCSTNFVTYAVGGIGQQMHGYAAYVPRDVVESGRRKLVH